MGERVNDFNEILNLHKVNLEYKKCFAITNNKMTAL